MRTIRAFLWGCTLGLILGILYAPRRGEETRADVQRRLNEWRGLAQERLTTVRDLASIAFEQGSQDVQAALDQEHRATDRVAELAKKQGKRPS